MSDQYSTTRYRPPGHGPQAGEGKVPQKLTRRTVLGAVAGLCSLPAPLALAAVRGLSPHQLLVRRALRSGRAARLAAGIPDHWKPETRFGALVLQLGTSLKASGGPEGDSYLITGRRGEDEAPLLHAITRQGLADPEVIRVVTALVGHALFSGELGHIRLRDKARRTGPQVEIYRADLAEFGRVWALEFLHGKGGIR